jgi:hypothetical protein
MKRKLAVLLRKALWLLPLLVLGACGLLHDEFFYLDRAAPPPAADAGVPR